jgi:hypothetical protein
MITIIQSNMNIRELSFGNSDKSGKKNFFYIFCSVCTWTLSHLIHNLCSWKTVIRSLICINTLSHECILCLNSVNTFPTNFILCTVSFQFELGFQPAKWYELDCCSAKWYEYGFCSAKWFEYDFWSAQWTERSFWSARQWKKCNCTDTTKYVCGPSVIDSSRRAIWL